MAQKKVTKKTCPQHSRHAHGADGRASLRASANCGFYVNCNVFGVSPYRHSMLTILELKFLKKLCSLLILSTLLIAGCSEKKVEPPPLPMVKTVTASQADKIVSDVYPAIVKGRYESNLAFQTGGRIISRDVEKGSFVSAGQVLMIIDARDAVQQLNAGESQVELCRSQLNLAKSNLERYAALYKENAVAAATLDQYQAAYDNAVAAYNAAVAQAEQARNVLNYTKLTANADGVISAVNAEIGQVVSAGQTVLTLVQTNELEVEIDVPENHLKNISIGKIADVTFWAVNSRTQGVVREIAPMADSAARTYRVRLSLTNPPPNIQLGMTAEVILNAAAENTGAVILPLSAIYQTDDTAKVWIVTNENKVALKNVTVENFSGNEVLVRGISPHDKVVTAGVHKLREGEEVRIKN